MITADQLKEWLTHPVTKEFMEVILSEEGSIREKIGQGALIGNETSPEIVGANYYLNVGKADGVQSLYFAEDRFYDHERVIDDEPEEEPEASR